MQIGRKRKKPNPYMKFPGFSKHEKQQNAELLIRLSENKIIIQIILIYVIDWKWCSIDETRKIFWIIYFTTLNHCILLPVYAIKRLSL